MTNLIKVLQVAAALGLLNVWILRFNRRTAYRGGSAGTIVEEFAAYGLPAWFAYLVGALKVGAAVAFIAGLWFPSLVFPAASLVCVLMVGALAMHARIGDPLKKSVPALAMLLLGLGICWGSFG